MALLQGHDTTTLTIGGMHCGGYARSIEQALREVSSVSAVSADASTKTADVPGSASANDLLAAVAAAG